MHVIKFLTAALIFTVFHLPGHSQVVESAEVEKNKGHLYINGYVNYLKNPSIISFDSAIGLFMQNRFSRLADEKIIFNGYDPNFYWFRFIIHNASASERKLIFMQAGLGIRDSELWQVNGENRISLGKTGYKYPYHARPYQNVHYCHPITIAADSTDTFYLFKDESHAFKVNGFVLNDPDSLKKKEVNFYFLFGNMLGLLVLFIFINFYLYFAIKEKIHLWYCGYLLFTLFFLIKNEGLDAEFLGLDSEAGYRSTSMGGFASLAMGFLVKVVQLFLVNIRRKSILFRSMEFTKWLAWTGGIFFFLDFYFQPPHFIDLVAYYWGNKSVILTLLVVPVACIYSFSKGYKPALFILGGMSLLLIGGILRSLFIMEESYLFPPTLFEIGMVAEAIIISFGLMYRYNQFKKEKELLKTELDRQQHEVARQVIVAQEAEQKRIAEDLHDELGGNLAAIKMALQRFNLPAAQLAEMNHLIDKASTNARNISHNLMPPEFTETRLKELLENNFRRLNKESNVHFYFHYTGSNHHFDKQEELMIYRIVMELTNNIIKHAKATESTIQFIYHEKHLTLVIEDNGKGFYNDSYKGIGLKNIQSRVKYLNGSLDIDSGNHGTTIMIQIPYKEDNEKN
jgi:signal transduction histidine kinase